MKLPNGDRAIVDMGKLRTYSLNMDHDVGKHKARLFRSVLGLTLQNAVELQAALLAAAKSQDAVYRGTDTHGARYMIDFEMTRGAYRAVIRSGWIIRLNESLPRLTTCYLRKGG